MKKPRILLIHNSYQYPGGEDVVFSMERSLLINNGHEVFTYTDNNCRVQSLGKFNSAIQTVWSQPSYKSIKETLCSVKPDVVHFHNTFLLISPSAYYACAEKKIPVIQTLHNYRLLCPNAYFFRNGKICEDCLGKFFPFPGIKHKCYRNSFSETLVVGTMLGFHNLIQTWKTKVTRYIALTEFSQSKFTQSGISETKISIKPNFVWDNNVTPQNNTRNFALYIGHISTEKGIDILLSGWESLNIPLKIIGDGPLIEMVKKIIEKNPSIEYLGQLEHSQVRKYLQSARFLVFPSRMYEGFGLSIIEAFASYTPVLAMNIPPRTELIKQNITGLLYKQNDSGDLALKAQWLWDHQKECREMGKNARNEFEMKYTPTRNYDILRNIYDSVLG